MAGGRWDDAMWRPEQEQNRSVSWGGAQIGDAGPPSLCALYDEGFRVVQVERGLERVSPVTKRWDLFCHNLLLDGSLEERACEYILPHHVLFVLFCSNTSGK